MIAASSTASTELINGRYRLLRQLGEGAMGSVKLVADIIDDDRLLALKTLRPGVLLAEEARLREEFLAMTQLRHPNVVEVYDFGIVASRGDHFFTMDFVDGKNLFEAAEAYGREKVYDYALQICSALEYIHLQGFIHFDLKPENIMVDRAGVVRVMDFGLVEKGSFFDAQVLKGTAAYIAPEMVMSGRVDHRLDLYALGAVLFHVLTGRVLFPGRNLMDTLMAHVSELPNFTDDVKVPLTAPFDRILRRLLAKDPQDRYASAAEVLGELERAADRPRTSSGRNSMALYKLGSRLVGREKQLNRLLGNLRGMLAPQSESPAPGAVFVTGSSGMGKSRLIEELRHEAQVAGVGFAHGACLQNGGHSYLPFVEILRTLVREILGSSSEVVDAAEIPRPAALSATLNGSPLMTFARSLHPQSDLGVSTIRSKRGTIRISEPGTEQTPLESVIGIGPQKSIPGVSDIPPAMEVALTGLSERGWRELVEANAAALAILLPEEVHIQELAKLHQPDPRVKRDQEWLIEAISKFLVDLSRAHPLLLYCSDLHWADDLTIELFSRLSRAAHAHRLPGENEPKLLVCGCLRDDEIAGTSLEKAVAVLTKDAIAETIPLEPLDSAAIAEMARLMLGHIELGPEALQALVERTGGVPFAVEATLRDILQHHASQLRGSARHIDTGEFSVTFAPASVTEALDRALENASSDEVYVIRMLSVFNRPATVALLREPGSISTSSIRNALAQLRSRHLVQRAWADGNHQWSLRHAKLRDHIYFGIDENARVELHAAAASALDKLHTGVERYLEDIAQHYVQAKDLGRAIYYLQMAGDKAKRMYDWKRAGLLYARAYDALSTLPPTDNHRLLSADLAIAIAEVTCYTPSEVMATRLKQALAFIGETDMNRRAQLQNWLGRTYYALGRQQEALGCFQELIRLTAGTADDLTRALPYQVLGRVYIFLGRFEQARDYLKRAAALLRAHPGTEDDLSYVLGMLGGAYAYNGEFRLAEEMTLEAIEIGERIGHHMRSNQGRIYLGIVYAVQGRWDDALNVLERAVEDARRDNNVIGAGTGSSFLGAAYLAQGNAARAVELCKFGRNHIASAGGTWTFSMVGTQLAEALLANGEADRAREVALETQKVVDAGERWGEVWLHVVKGRIFEHFDESMAALQSFDKAVEVALNQKNVIFEAKAYLAKGTLLIRLGRVDEGRELVESARHSFETMNMRWHAERAKAVLAGDTSIFTCT